MTSPAAWTRPLGLRYQRDTQKRSGTVLGGAPFASELDYEKTFDAI
ncbi:MAG: hypothetical protein AAF999_07840 [Pseudomonadota bacterium]